MGTGAGPSQHGAALADRGHESQDREDLRDAIAAIPATKRKQYAYWLSEYRQDWRGEVPTRLHEKGTFGLGSAPPFSSEFIGYVGFIECKQPGCSHCAKQRARVHRQKHFRHDDSRYRTSKAFRKLRSVAPREFDALYMYCVLGFTTFDIARSMNEEMARKQKDERFFPESIALLLYSGVDKAMGWW